MTNSITVNLPKLYAKQYDALCDPARICCIESTTKAGKTIGSVVWQIGEILKASPGTEHWWVAPVYPQADMAYRLALSSPLVTAPSSAPVTAGGRSGLLINRIISTARPCTRLF